MPRHPGGATRLLGAVAAAGASMVGASALGSSTAAAAQSDARAASGPLPAQTRAKLTRIVREVQRTNRAPGLLIGVWTRGPGHHPAAPQAHQRHREPLPHRPGARGTSCTPADLLALGASAPPVGPPGTRWAYSNYGDNLLGRVVGARLRPGAQHGDSRAHRPAARRAPHAPPHLRERARQPLRPRVRARKRRLEAGATRLQRPGRWRQGLGFVEAGGFIGKEGSLPGYESVSLYSPARRTAIVVVSTKQANAVTPSPLSQALAMAVLGSHIGFGLTPAQAVAPNDFGGDP